ncbi:glycosyltransferase family 2 protein [Rhodanobacter denitrificans]|uniref:Glycosyltransferase family 2 protein n=1 Tax=Rhodanobacter denitrificans TaxID=666685 RepID=A0A368KHX9_9GAMM|nr:glycosyltransferase family 2 protein [Rhodanobacter denitrificans]RCS31539.1 glycosyltransferase family 2 protein [Rhodanobacter denitrificans]
MALCNSTKPPKNLDEICSKQIAVVIPCYKVRKHILDVISAIGSECVAIYVVDDCCPESSGNWVSQHCTDPRVRIIRHEQNQGVGGAVISGYRQALADGMDIIVKIDGDGQMDPTLIKYFLAPIAFGEADYTKGNRFYHLKSVASMPRMRILGNAGLSFLNKLSTGYWNIFDPTNGYTAIHRDALSVLDLEKISSRYFFETDLLFRLNLAHGVVVDVPMDAKYADEVSSLSISGVFFEFLGKHLRNFMKRIFYNYFLRDMSAASFELLFGALLMLFGTLFSSYHWIYSSRLHVATPTGTVIIGALALLSGLQLLLAFITHDVESQPKIPIQRLNYGN